MEKSHWDWTGLHCANRMMMHTAKLSMQHPARPQRMTCCNRPGFMMRVSKATTASLGMPKAMTPKGNPNIVKRIASCFCDRERVSKCLPLPRRTAIIERAT